MQHWADGAEVRGKSSFFSFQAALSCFCVEVNLCDWALCPPAPPSLPAIPICAGGAWNPAALKTSFTSDPNHQRGPRALLT